MSEASSKPLFCITCGKRYIVGDTIYTIATDEDKGEFQHLECRPSAKELLNKADELQAKANKIMDDLRKLIRK